MLKVFAVLVTAVALFEVAALLARTTRRIRYALISRRLFAAAAAASARSANSASAPPASRASLERSE